MGLEEEEEAAALFITSFIILLQGFRNSFRLNIIAILTEFKVFGNVIAIIDRRACYRSQWVSYELI